MADLLNTIFYSFWTFAGTAILLGIVARAFITILAVVLMAVKP